MPKYPRRRIGQNLYQDAAGIAAIARAAGVVREKRFPLDTPRRDLLAWQDTARQEMRDAAATGRLLAPPGSLAEAVAGYLRPLSGKRLRDTRNLLMHWVDALPGVTVSALTVARLRAVVVGWQDAGRAASTINHRRRALIALFDTMGLSENLARKLPRLVEPPPQPRAIDIGLAAALIASLPDMGRRDKGRSSYGTQSKTKARLRVMLWTGLPPATIARILPSDVDLDGRTVFVRPRRKGAGAPGATLPLVPEAVAAFRQWLSAVAWGPFSGGSMWKTFQRGVRAYKAQREAEGIPVTLPDDLRPYDPRHTFLSWLLELTGDIVAVKEYAQHTDLRSTLRYAQRGATARVVAAIETVARVRGTASRP